ncbi:MAG TPA: Crp/Fnr family transcriptional regulator, partial [Cyclobacteriaceae bacterium]|nr:Crp/Fnr family transcriptional regulator [Cyclobacteriaceae bacterium]
QYLLNAGDKCQYLTFVEKGLLRSFSVDDNGSEHVMQFALEGWWISDMASFLCGDDALYNIEALEDCEVLLLSKESMDEMIERMGRMERYFRLMMQNNIIALQRRIRVVQTLSAEETYRKLLEASPEIFNRASQQHIASYMGISPETLSRVRKQVAKG